MPVYKHIIWDWNGTLLDDTWLCLEIMNTQLSKRHIPSITYDIYQEVFDFPVKNYYEKVGFDFSRESYETVAQDFIDEYTRRRFECSLHPGVEAILEKCARYGCVHSILSAYADSALKEMIAHYRLIPYFAHILGQDNHYAFGKKLEGKKLIETLSLKPSEVVLVGDTTHDHEVAGELGIQSILVAHGHQSKKRLIACGARVVDSFSEAMIYII